MNRINNLFLIIRNVLVGIWSMLRWLSEDKTTAQLQEAFGTATKIATRAIKFYSESAGTIQKGARIITRAADELSELSPEMERVASSYIDDIESLTKKAKPAKAAKAADRPKRKYTRRAASITITKITNPNRSASASSPVCTPTDCKICDKAETCPKKGTWEADW